MKSLLQLLAVFFLAALALFVMPALVQCADAEQAAPETEAVPACLMQLVADVPAGTADIPQAESSVHRTEAGLFVLMSARTAVQVVSDANGCPLGSMSWFRAVWAANPPESIPGS